MMDSNDSYEDSTTDTSSENDLSNPSGTLLNQQTSSQHFLFFPKLPVELRLKIWRLHFPEPRRVLVIPPALVGQELQFWKTIASLRQEFPTGVAVNKESRVETLKYYTFVIPRVHGADSEDNVLDWEKKQSGTQNENWRQPMLGPVWIKPCSDSVIANACITLKWLHCFEDQSVLARISTLEIAGFHPFYGPEKDDAKHILNALRNHLTGVETLCLTVNDVVDVRVDRCRSITLNAEGLLYHLIDGFDKTEPSGKWKSTLYKIPNVYVRGITPPCMDALTAKELADSEVSPSEGTSILKCFYEGGPVGTPMFTEERFKRRPRPCPGCGGRCNE